MCLMVTWFALSVLLGARIADGTRKIVCRESIFNFVMSMEDISLMIISVPLESGSRKMSEYIVRETDCGLATKQEIVGELVRCKDCKYYYTYGEDGYETCDNSEGYDHVTAEGFCYWGKRKDDVQSI